MKLFSALALLLTFSLSAHAYNPSRPSAPRSPVKGAIEGKWTYQTGSWPDAAKVSVTIGRDSSTFVTELLTAGQNCVASLTVATSYDDRTFSVLETKHVRGSSFFGSGCDVNVVARSLNYEIRGNELTIIDLGGASTTYQRESRRR